MAAEEINWSYIPEQKISGNIFVGFFVLILLVIPFVMYLLSVVYYERTLDSLMGVQQGVLGFLYTNVFFVLMLVVDQVPFASSDRNKNHRSYVFTEEVHEATPDAGNQVHKHQSVQPELEFVLPFFRFHASLEF